MSETLLISLAAILILGISAQWIAWRVRLPSILLLLLCGFVAGPILGWLKPDDLFGDLLMPMVSLSVGLIMFEGGLTLKFSELKAVGSVVRNLITIGALVTWFLATIAAHWLFGWDWTLALLLGAVLIVTGPTVIMPLLRHVKPARQISSTLKWEGILIDPVGALVALLVFEAIVAHGEQSVPMHVILSVGRTLLIGGCLGIVSGLALMFAFKRYWIPDFLQSPFTMMLVVGIFTISNHFQHESGLLTVTVMGITLANQHRVSVHHVLEFKENLRVLLISTLFILLSARVQWEDFKQLNPISCLLFLAVLMMIIRPASVLVSSWGSSLTWKDKAFLAWMAPRGIVAAAVSSIFALRLVENGHARAAELVPATFLVIVGTVAIYGLSSSPLARALQLSSPNPQGILFVGATRLTRALAKGLQDLGFVVLVADTNRDNTSTARMEGLPVYEGNVLDEKSKDEIELTGIGRMVALTPNHEVNSMAALHFREFFGRQEVYQVGVHAEAARTTRSAPHGRLLFGKDVLYRKLNELIFRDGVVRTTKLTESYPYEKWVQEQGAESIPLFLMTENKILRLLTEDQPFEPLPGQTIIALGPPKEKDTPEDGAS